ncbi:hypothetical protein HLASA_1818 [Halanaeroarchaeum sulfurireducens]|uniref:Uncharacterized protein n=1 Tax=Halanaeroarchaeum sulfurireducens TaxID=1604004 RepID=A0A0N9NCE9_9EURY|nr:hypothetical protein HLASA_1818 [Halanaeroarchaeum sulfurireducens]
MPEHFTWNEGRSSPRARRSASVFSGCLGSQSGKPDAPPYADRIVFETQDDSAPVSNAWFYRERLTDGATVEGLERPVYIAVFADWIDSYDDKPPEDEPSRSFEVEEGRVVRMSGHEPTNDVYIALKRRDEGPTLTFIAKEATAPSRLLFDDGLLFHTGDVERGASFELPP